MKRKIFLFLFVIFLISFVLASELTFLSLTPASGISLVNTSIEINVSISEPNLNSLIYNWNGTNYTICNDSLVLMMNFENLSSLGENATHVVDNSKYSNNGAIIGGTLWNNSGKYGGTYQFDGVNDYVSIPNSNSLNPNYITLSAWIKSNNISNSDSGAPLAAKGNGAGGEVWAMDFVDPGNGSSNQLRFYFWKGGGAYGCSSISRISPYQWYYVVGMYNGTTISIYVNGILDINCSANQGALSSNTHIVSVGSRQSGSADYDLNFNGSIDEVRIWNRSLTQDEIQQFYMSNLQKFNQTQWYLYVNQSKNSTTGLTNGTYFYQVFATNYSGNLNSTEQRIVTIGREIDTTSPAINFTNPTPASGISLVNTSIEINVSISEPNLNSLIYNWNGTNFSFYDSTLKLMFNFDNITSIGENTTKVVDISGFANNGTCFNCPIWNSSGKFGSSYQFDGINDYYSIPDSSSLDGYNTHTISVWVYPNNYSQQVVIMKATDSWMGCIYGIELEASGAIRAHDHNTDNTNIVDFQGGNYSKNSWNHIVFVLNSTHGIIYLNGIAVNSSVRSSGTLDNNNYLVSVGANQAATYTRYLNGSIDELRIWNRSLSANEVYQEYSSNLNKFNSTQWYLYVNQSQNATNRLMDGTYTYQAFVTDSSGNLNSTEQRTVTINSSNSITDCTEINSPGSYILAANITNSTSTYCIKLLTSNISLDCQGHTIDGKDTSGTYGIYALGSYSSTFNNITILNCKVSDWLYGIYLYYSSNITINNTNSSSNIWAGTYLLGSNTVSITNSQFDNNLWGIYSSSSNIIVNNTIANSNGWDGITLNYVSTVSNSVFKNNGMYDLNFGSESCNGFYNNLTGTGDKPIFFYNGTINLNGWNNNVSEIILCNADNSNVSNINLSGVDSNGFFIHYSDNINVTNINLTDLYEGIYYSYGDNSYFSNIIGVSSSSSAILATYAVNLTITNDVFVSNGKGVLFSYVRNSSIFNVNMTSNSMGIFLQSSSQYNTFYNTKFKNNYYGIYFSPPTNTNNRIYNNFFNNTENLYFLADSVSIHEFNTTKQTGTRIYSNGIEIGGNYWADYLGAGYSETCKDLDGDGFCDLEFNVTTDGRNKDYLPLSGRYGNDSIYPIFFNYFDNNATFVESGIALFNVTINNTNGTVIFQINSTTNYTAQNLTSNVYNISINLSNGTYTYYWHSYGNGTSYNYNLTKGRYYTINETLYDRDNDGVQDSSDNLEGNESDVTKSGVNSLNITVSGNSTSGSYNNTQEVVFYDSGVRIVNFTYNFSLAELDLSKVIIIKDTNYIIVNLSGQLQAKYNKTLYLIDNSFISLCVKDAEVASISEISSGCNGENEIDFTSCLGNSSGLIINGTICNDSGSIISVSNLRYSGIKGTTSIPVLPSSGLSSGGSSSSGGGEIKPKKLECNSDSECKETYSCYQNKCVKLFDIEIKKIEPLTDSLNFSLTYLVKGMADIKGDVIITFWIENDKEKINLGQDTIYLGAFETKTKTAELILPNKVMNDTYNLYVQTKYENYEAQSFRKINIKVPGDLLPKSETGIASEEYKKLFEKSLFIYFIFIFLLLFIIVLFYLAIRNKQFLISQLKIVKKQSYGKHNYLNNLIDKEVFSDLGNKIGKIEEVIVLRHKIYGFLVSLDKIYENNKKILIKQMDIKSIKEVVIVDSEIEKKLNEVGIIRKFENEFVVLERDLKKGEELVEKEVKKGFKWFKNDLNKSKEIIKKDLDKGKEIIQEDTNELVKISTKEINKLDKFVNKEFKVYSSFIGRQYKLIKKNLIDFENKMSKFLRFK